VQTDDDSVLNPPSHAEDRLWRHPSERAKQPFSNEVDEYYEALRRARRLVIATGALVIGLSILTAFILVRTMSDPEDHRFPIPAEIATVSLTTAPNAVLIDAHN
jgi:hypothetical protein